MSTTDATTKTGQPRGLDPPDAPSSLPLPRFETPIVPQATISGRALVAAGAVRTLLARLPAGAVRRVRASAIDGQADGPRAVTLQIRPVAGPDIEVAVVKAVVITRASAGIAEVRPY